jgi:hypothetical protein
MRKKIVFLISVLLLSSLVTACSGVALAQSETPVAPGQLPQPVNRTLNVTGSGRVYLVPDIAYVSIGVHTENVSAAEAVAANNSQSEKVIAAIKGFNVDAKDIQTGNFSIYPQQQFDPQGKPTGEITYIVDNSVNITVRNLGQLGDLLDAAVTAGANSIYGVQFDVADKSAAILQARQLAMQNAESVAQELAKAAGVTLGVIQTINVYGGDSPAPVFMSGSGGAVMEKAASVPVSPGQLMVSVDVNVVYEIR